MIIVVESDSREKRAVAVQHFDNENIMNVVCDYIKENNDIVEMYNVKDEVVAEKVVTEFNDNHNKSISSIIEDYTVYQRLEYVREDTDADNRKLSRMDADTIAMIEKETDCVKDKLDLYCSMMKDILGDGAYTWSIQQIIHHLGQIRNDLFDVLAGLVSDAE